MPKIREDSKGKYFVSEGQIVRPVDSTRYEVDTSVDASQCKGTPIYGVGKDESCGRGEYLEAWFDTGLESNVHSSLNEGKIDENDPLLKVEEVQRMVLEDYPITYIDNKVSFVTIKNSHKEIVESGNSSIAKALKESLSDEMGDIPPLNIFDDNGEDNV